MPAGTPSIKVRAVERLGAKVVIHGADFDAAKLECARLAKAHGLIFVPPYDDPYVIAGQGTIGLEILKQLRNRDTLDAVFGAVGGGGLISGVAAYVKRIGSPNTQVIGVETIDGDAMAQSLAKGERVLLTDVGPFADGTAVKIVGEEPFRLCQKDLDSIVKADNDEICAAIKDIFEGPFLSLSSFPCPWPHTPIRRHSFNNGTLRRTSGRRPKTIRPRQRPRWGKQTLRRCRLRREHELRPIKIRR